MRTKQFPHKRASKLSLHGDGPFRVLEQIKNNAYKLELPGEFTMSHTFNVTGLSPYEAGERSVLRTKPLEEGGNDVDIVPTNRPDQESSPIPEVPTGPLTRSKAKKLAKGFNVAVETLLNTRDEMHEEITAVLKKLKLREEEDGTEVEAGAATLWTSELREEEELGEEGQLRDKAQEKLEEEGKHEEDGLKADGTVRLAHIAKLTKPT